MLTIRPPSGWAALHLADIWQFRDLMFTLAGRDLKVRYKQTALGVIWVVLQPLLAAGVFSILFGAIAQFPSDGVPYFLFSYVGMLAWNLFSGVLARSSGCLTGNAHLISKVFFPRLVLPLSTVGSAMVDFLVAAALLVVLMPANHIYPTWTLLLVPIWTIGLLMLSLGVGLVAAALTVSYRDVQYVLPVMINLMQFASPVAYPAWFASEKLNKHLPAYMHGILYLNPLTGLFEWFRWSFFAGSPTQPPAPALWTALYSLVCAVFLVWVGAVAFKQMERKFADVI